MPIGTRSLRIGLGFGVRIGLSADSSTDLMVVKIGDSGATGFGTGDAADTGFLVGTPNVNVLSNERYATATGPPPVFIDFPAFRQVGPLSLYDISGNQSMGSEMSLGPGLLTASSRPCFAKVAVTGSTLAVEWLPTGTYPAAGAGNLYNLSIAQIHAIESVVGRKTDVLIIELGTNDAADAGQTTAFQANETALIAQARIDLPGVKIVLVRPNPNVPNAGIAAVITAVNNIITGDPTIGLAETDDCPLSGSFHATSNGYLSQGQREAGAVKRVKSLAAQSFSLVDVVGYGPIAQLAGTGVLTVIPWGDQPQNNDLEVMCVVLGLATETPTVDATWTLKSSSGDATAIGVHENMFVYSRPVTTALLNANNQHMPAGTVTTATATRTAAKIFTLRSAGTPSIGNVQGTKIDAIGAGPNTITGINTTVANALLMRFTGGYCGQDPLTTLTEPTATGVRKVQDSDANIVTDREIITLHVSRMASPGATGNATQTSTQNMIVVACTLEGKP